MGEGETEETGEKRVWRNAVVPPRVRNKEQKIDRLLSFMFLRREKDSSVCVRPSPLSRLPSPCPSLSTPALLSCLIYPPTYLSPFPPFAATYNKTNRGNSTRRAMGKEPGGMQKNAKETGRDGGRGWRGYGAAGKGGIGGGKREKRANERHVYAKKEQESGVRGNRTGLHSSSATDRPGFLTGNRIQLSGVGIVSTRETPSR